MKSRWLRALLLFGLGVGLLGCDHATKTLAREHLAGRPPKTLVRDRIELRYAENRGAAFSAERYLGPAVGQWLLPLGRGLALGLLGLLWWRRRRDARLLEHAAFVMLAAGALGNTVERWVSGAVVDFIYVRPWPIFNLADVYLSVGVALLLLLFWRQSRHGSPPPGLAPPTTIPPAARP